MYRSEIYAKQATDMSVPPPHPQQPVVVQQRKPGHVYQKKFFLIFFLVFPKVGIIFNDVNLMPYALQKLVIYTVNLNDLKSLTFQHLLSPLKMVKIANPATVTKVAYNYLFQKHFLHRQSNNDVVFENHRLIANNRLHITKREIQTTNRYHFLAHPVHVLSF